jgi:diguanylate cyclase (GGDEF)-like protein/PAS domain S-box-containing protein
MLPSSQLEQVLAAILEATEDAVLGLGLDGKIEMWSQGAERLYGYAAAEVMGQSVAHLLPLYEVPAIEALLAGAQEGTIKSYEVVDRLRKNGAKVSVEVRRTALRGQGGKVTGIFESGRKLGHGTKESTSDNQLRLLMEQMPVVLWTTDQNLRITSSWGSGLQNSSAQMEDLVGQTVSEYLKCPETNTAPLTHHFAALRGESVHFEHKRESRVLDVHLEPLRAPSGEIIGCIGVGLDITQRMRSEEQIRYQATHDALTGLANYREFMDTLERELRRAERSHHSFTVMLLDLDDLKRINDRLGHLAGNRALKRLAAVMREQCRSTDVIARYGGDEFAVVLIDSDQHMADQVAQRIETALREDRGDPRISVSIGIGVYPNDGRTAQDLIEAADRQLYRRKKIGQNRNVTVG